MDPAVLLQLDGDGPLYRQTYRALRERILAGALAPGSRLPATRELSRALAVSRNTVIEAYRQLVDEGYASARIGSGTTVASALPEARTTAAPPRAPDDARAPAHAPLPLSREATRGLDGNPRSALSWQLPRRNLAYDFRYGEPAYADLPLSTWQRLVGRHARRASARRLAYTHPGGAPELREALADYLSRVRGVRCDPGRVLVTYGSQQAIDLVCRVLVDPGDRVAIEEPHYSGLSLRLAAAGAETVVIPVDEEGMQVERLAGERELRLVCVTPSHQFPTGGILPLRRRLALLEHAGRCGACVLEDDYDSEFRYDGRPVECLQGLDEAGRVLYTGSASKLLFPSLRIGWLVVPEALVRPFAVAKALADTGTAGLEQLALASFIEAGALDRHVRRMRVRNAARRAALLEAVEEELGDRGRVRGAAAGLHVLLELPDLEAKHATELRRRCERSGVGIYPVTPYYRQPPAHASFLLGYASLEEADIREGVRRIAAALARIDAE
jgi:GntR family transcriptional regulator/MocR family aminotransferase